jgi:hypothetical protein
VRISKTRFAPEAVVGVMADAEVVPDGVALLAHPEMMAPSRNAGMTSDLCMEFV